VKRIWSTSICNPNEYRHQMRFFADGLPGLVFLQAEEPVLYNHEKKLASIFVYGQTVKPVVFTATGPCTVIVFVFYPDVVQQLFAIPANEVTDTCLDIDSFQMSRKHWLTERMLTAPGKESKIEIMERFVYDLILSSRLQIDQLVRRATQLMHNNGGNEKIIEIASELGISERTLGRRFERNVGVVPKTFSSILRFQTALNHLQARNFDSLSGLAFDLGYADQSHFNRSFKLYTGTTPLEYLSKEGSLSAATLL
jgi:AraC-like DNA-binding protein